MDQRDGGARPRGCGAGGAPRSARRAGFGRSVAATLTLLCVSSPASAISVEFDFGFDQSGYFDAAPVRDVFDEAARTFEVLEDRLLPIDPGAGRSWTAEVLNPGTFQRVQLVDLALPEDTLRIFVGGRPYPQGVLGFAGAGEIASISGDALWEEQVRARGQLGALEPIPTDVAPWGGYMVINTQMDWNLLLDDQAIFTGPDLLTTVRHEVAHILGFGDAASWNALVAEDEEGYLFLGERSTALAGGPVRLDTYASHWEEGTEGLVDGVWQETLMDPSTPFGERQQMTDLDWAGLEDVGWQVVPEPGTGLLVSLGLLVLGRRRGPTASTFRKGAEPRVRADPLGVRIRPDSRIHSKIYHLPRDPGDRGKGDVANGPAFITTRRINTERRTP